MVLVDWPIFRVLRFAEKPERHRTGGHDHSSFMGFAPMNKPKIAVLVYVENGGWGATFGVPYGALIMEQYLNGKLSPESEVRGGGTL